VIVMEASKLKVHEWMAISILIATVGGLALITSCKNNASLTSFGRESVVERQSGVDIIVKGAVDYPGVYRLPSQLSMRDVLKIASMQPNASIGRYNLDRIVKRGRIIDVPYRKMLKGAVKNAGTSSVPKGAKLAGLNDIVVLDEDMNKKMLDKKRILMPDDIVEMPLCRN